MPSLTTLDLDANEISCSGASAIAQYLTGLTTLDLARNQIGDDGAIAIAQHLRALKTLHLGSANIGEAGAKFIAKSLTHLTTLDLGLNNIGENGARAIAQYLVNLKMLYLARNSIGEGGAVAILDSWLVRSETTRLHYLDLRENGDLSALLPAEVLDNPFDPEAILAAYRRAVTSETRALNEAKLLVVGDEAVGKTSLLRYMIHGQPRNPSEDKTLGVAHEKIEIETWAPEAGDVRLNVWDFAGQKKMRGTHRFFLTARSLYLLVLEDRREDDRSIHDWLRTIKNRGAGSPILVVINKSDDGKAMLRLDEQGLRENYPEIVGFLRTSCNDDDFSRKSIQALRERIAGTVAGDERLKHVWDALPKSWLRVKDRITDLAAERAVLPLAEFQTLCAAGDSEVEQVADPDEQRALLRLLHDLGTIVAHGLEAGARAVHREITLLDPNWLTEAVYRILTGADCAELQGRFNARHLERWLDPAAYPKTRHEFILDMMQDEEVGLCFPLPGAGERHYLIPEALPPSAPYLGDWKDSLRFRYRYAFLPRGLVPRFIVQAHDLLAEPPTRWRTGAVFKVQGCPILVQADLDQRRIDLQVAGPPARRRGALDVIRHHLETVHKKNPEAAPTALVPLPDQPECDEKYDFLLRLEEQRGPEYRHWPTDANRDYSVAELLNGVREGQSRKVSATPEPEQHQKPEAVKTPPEKNWVDILTSWPVIALAVASGAMLFFIVLQEIEDPEWRFRIGGSVATFAAVFLLVSFFNPERRVWRLINLFLFAGITINGAGFAIDAFASGEIAIGSFKWDGRVDSSFNYAWAGIAIALIILVLPPFNRTPRRVVGL